MLPKDSTAFLATNVWTAGVCNRIQPAKSSETIATMVPQNIFRAFFNHRKPWRSASVANNNKDTKYPLD